MPRRKSPQLTEDENCPLTRQDLIIPQRFRSQTYIIVYLVFKVFITLKKLFFGILSMNKLAL